MATMISTKDQTICSSDTATTSLIVVIADCGAKTALSPPEIPKDLIDEQKDWKPGNRFQRRNGFWKESFKVIERWREELVQKNEFLRDLVKVRAIRKGKKNGRRPRLKGKRRR